jgi:cytochrome c peroxidase
MIYLRPRSISSLVAVLISATIASASIFSPFLPAVNPAGVVRTITTSAGMDIVGNEKQASDNPFSTSLGTNGRSCATCHIPEDGWSITPSAVQRRFDDTEGLDPIFRANDGATSPQADVSTIAARRAAYSMLLSKGLIRVGLPIPANAEFELAEVDDPYGFATAAELSLFRRPLPSTNLRFLTTVMWDGRESSTEETIPASLAHQANAATVGHAEGTPIPQEVRERIVNFEIGMLTAQIVDRLAGRLDTAGATGGPQSLATEVFWPKINSALDPTGAVPTVKVFSLFDAWLTAVGPKSLQRQTIARGQALFNTRTFGRGATCSGCHNTPNVGSNSVGSFINLGTSAEVRRTSDLPLYTLVCRSGTLVGRTFVTSDPGVALITGRCDDIDRFKVPALRALASRPPYFHNGMAATLDAVVDFYNERFAIGLTPLEKADLAAFLNAL